MVIGNFMVTW